MEAINQYFQKDITEQHRRESMSFFPTMLKKAILFYFKQTPPVFLLVLKLGTEY